MGEIASRQKFRRHGLNAEEECSRAGGQRLVVTLVLARAGQTAPGDQERKELTRYQRRVAAVSTSAAASFIWRRNQRQLAQQSCSTLPDAPGPRRRAWPGLQLQGRRSHPEHVALSHGDEVLRGQGCCGGPPRKPAGSFPGGCVRGVLYPWNAVSLGRPGCLLSQSSREGRAGHTRAPRIPAGC